MTNQKGEENEQLTSWEVLKHMRRLECTVYKRPVDLLEPFNGLWRQQIVEWMYTLIKFCDLRHEAASAATFYLDVSVSKGLITTPKDYQLGALTAFYLALKVFDSPSMRTVKLSSLIKLGNGHFGEADVINMEREMLCNVLEWKVNPPTPNCFVQQYLTLFSKSDIDCEAIQKLENLALEYIEKCLARDNTFSSTPPSLLAYASILMAMKDIGPSEIPLDRIDLFLLAMVDVAKQDSSSPSLNFVTLLMERTFGTKGDANDEDPASTIVEMVVDPEQEDDDPDNPTALYGLKLLYDGSSPNCVGMQ